MVWIGGVWVLGGYNWGCFFIFGLCVCNGCDNEYNGDGLKTVARGP